MIKRIDFDTLAEAITHASKNGGRIWSGDNGQVSWFPVEIVPSDILPNVPGNGTLAGIDDTIAQLIRRSAGLLASSAYKDTIRLPKCAGEVCVLTAHHSGYKVLIRLKPEWTKEDHERLDATHTDLKLALRAAWGHEFEAACQETFGRPSEIGDYKISGIGRSEFTEERKDRLRTLAHSDSKHSTIGAAHSEAARHRNRFKC